MNAYDRNKDLEKQKVRGTVLKRGFVICEVTNKDVLTSSEYLLGNNRLLGNSTIETSQKMLQTYSNSPLT